MNRKPIHPELSQYPETYHPLLLNAPVFDSSCSKEAQVIFIEKNGGYFLKSAPAGTLKQEAEMTRYFHMKGLSAEVLDYRTEKRDFLLTRKIPGEDCTHSQYLENPKRLCDTIAEHLSLLHDTDFSDCPVQNKNERYFAAAKQGYRLQKYDAFLFPDGWGFRSSEEAWETVTKNVSYLKADVLLHGDYCLPNILLDKWKFSGFIDIGEGGVGDRHIDLFWGTWTLRYNLKTDCYYDRFLDAYGRSKINMDMLKAVAAFEVFR